MHKDLVQIHAKYNIYPESLLGSVDRSIINDISVFPDLKYLADFYDKYLLEYNSLNNQGANNEKYHSLSGQARSVDMPFLGQNVISQKKAKYMFVFEGSLQDTMRLSITVLSCFWLYKDLNKFKDIINTYWTLRSYKRINQSLKITPEVAESSYVVDSFRLGNERGRRDTRSNRALLLEEIELLNPELVILVGGTARDVVGQKYINKNSAQFYLVPFPTVRMTSEQKADAEKRYLQLTEFYRG